MDTGDEAIPFVRQLADFHPEAGAGDRVYETTQSRLTLHALAEGAPVHAEPGEVWIVRDGDLRFPGDPTPAGPHAVRLTMGGPVEGAGIALRYRATAPTADAPTAPEGGTANPNDVQGNVFRPLVSHGSAAAAVLGIAAGRRLNAGPETERTFLPLRASGLLFFEEGSTLPFRSGDVCVAPPGWPVRVWARGPDDAALLVLQPHGEAPAERRTLAGEIAKKRGGAPDA